MTPRDGLWLILGARGYVGRHVCAELERRAVPFVGTHRATSDIDGPAWQGGIAVATDPADPHALARLFREHQPEVVVVALGHGESGETDDLTALYVGRTRRLLETSRRAGHSPRFVLTGSAAEYGLIERGRASEDHPLRPLTDYGHAKVAEFEETRRLLRTRHEDIVWARIFNLLGPGQSDRLVAGAILARLAAGERPLRLNCADHLRDWIDVRDLARALVELGLSPDPPRVVNVCSGRARPVSAIGEELVRLAGGRLEPLSGPRGEDVLWRSVGSPQLLRELGWRPELAIETSLRDQWSHAGSPRQETPRA